MADEPAESLADKLITERGIIDALHRAVIVTTPDGRILLWNRAATDLYGWSEEEVLGRPVVDVVVPEPERSYAGEILSIVASGTSWDGDFSVMRRDGERIRVCVRNEPIVGPRGEVAAVVGVSEDVTEQRSLERRAADLAEHLSLALEAGGLGTWRWTLHTGEVEWDARLEQLFGLRPGEFDGKFETYAALLHPDDAETVLTTVAEAVEAKTSYVVDHRVVWPDGSVHWLQGKGHVIVDESGAVMGTIGCTGDVTEQMSLALQREEFTKLALHAAEIERISRERLEFLGRINDALAGSRTREELMRNVTTAAVPRLGDFCAIFVLTDPHSMVPEMEFSVADPSLRPYAKELLERRPYDPTRTSGIPFVIRSGRSEFLPQVEHDWIQTTAASEGARGALRDIAVGSALSVPLTKRGRILGAIQFVNAQSSRRYTADDLALGQAVAARIASSLENIRLNEHQRMIATTLQASLLPATLPEIPGLDIAVRYWANGEGIDVGGDFYDVFAVDDHWALVIGDVCGTGPVAASLTGLARHTIRAAAWHGAAPDEVLRQVNNAVLRSDQTTFCTVLYTTLAARRGGFVFETAAGGHPLPIVKRASGGTEIVGRPGTLLGMFPDPQSTTTCTELAPGDVVLLYTDGVTDVAPPHGITTEILGGLLAGSCSAASATEIADALGRELSSILPFAERHDDIALLVVKVAGG